MRRHGFHVALTGLVLAAGCYVGDEAAAPTPTSRPGKATTTSAPAATATTRAPTTRAPTATTTAATTAAPTTTTTGAPPAPTTAPPAGALAWSGCGNLECATLGVPLDYDNPSGRQITLALARRRAANPAARIGSLLFNPGGPGSSGVDGLGHELDTLTATLKARFDVVSWDPRGIGRSQPIRCHALAPPDPTDTGKAPPLDPAPTTPEGRQALAGGFRAYAQACVDHAGDVLGFVGTDSTADDMERIRVALGEERLTFMGHSAGTFLGAIYADRYPQRVRAFALDGAVDPSLTLPERVTAQAVGFEASLDAFFGWCAGTASCAWKPGPDPSAAFLSLMDRVRDRPLDAGDEVVGIDKLVSGTMGRLTTRSRWPSLAGALAAAERGDGGPYAAFATAYRDGGSTNAADARQAITCLDHPAPRDPDAYPGLAEAARARAPVFGPIFAWAALSCGVWMRPATLEARPRSAVGAPPILVIGTTGDPATPKAWAESLAAQLENGVLLLRQGAEHVAYYYSSCVRGIVDAYLVEGRLPADGTLCPS